MNCNRFLEVLITGKVGGEYEGHEHSRGGVSFQRTVVCFTVTFSREPDSENRSLRVFSRTEREERIEIGNSTI